MTIATTPAATNDAALDYVRTLVRERSAIVLDQGKNYLIEARLGPLARREGFDSLDALVAKLRTLPASDRLHELVIEAMTTNETSWFRDFAPFAALEKEILPPLLEARRNDRTLNIWSAACSSGQEPYTIAMILRERFPQLRDWNVRILATDISAEMLGRAAAGRYSQIEMNRGLPAQYLVKYFQREGTDWQVKDDLRSMIEFRSVNLIQSWGFVPAMDIVFLRNVLIYFDVETKRSILGRIHDQLRPGGTLFLGTAETTLNLEARFERVTFESTSYYRRGA